MRNLKKVLSLALAMVMLLGMMVVGASAADDYLAGVPEESKEAMAVMNAIEVIQGGDNGADPTGKLTRAMAARILCSMVSPNSSKIVANETRFADVNNNAKWAIPFVAYCDQVGLVSGDGNGKFNPNGNVKYAEFATMLVRALGYDAKNEKFGDTSDGNKWYSNALRVATRAGVAITAAPDHELTRAEAAQMAFQALTATLVEYKGMNVTAGDVVISSPATAKLHDETITGNDTTYDSSVITANTPIRFCEEYFPQLSLTREDNEDEFGRRCAVWTYKGLKVAGSETTIEPNIVYTTKVTKDTPADWAKLVNLKEGDTFALWINGEKVDAKNFTTDEDGKALTDPIKVGTQGWISRYTKNGRQVEVYLNKNNLTKVERVVVVDTVLAQVTKVNSDDTINVKLEKTVNGVTEGAVVLNTKEGVGSVELNDWVLVQGYGSEIIGKDTTVSFVEKATEVDGKAIKKNYASQTKAASIVVDGTTYVEAYAVVKDYSVKEFDLNEDGYNCKLYLDVYGKNILKAVEGKDPKAVQDNLIAVKETYQTLTNGKLVSMVKGVLSNGETVDWVLSTDSPLNREQVENGKKAKIYTWEKDTVKGGYQLSNLEPGKHEYKKDVDDKKNVPVAVSNTDTSEEIKFKSNDVFGKDGASKVMYSDSVKFIFVNNDGVSILNGRQTYDLAKGSILAQAYKNSEIVAVFMVADPDIVDVSDLIYVHSTFRLNDQLVDVNGKDVQYYGYKAYRSDGSEIEEFLGSENYMADSFNTIKMTDDGKAYQPNKGTKTVTEHTMTKGIVAKTDKNEALANGLTGDAFVLVDMKKADTATAPEGHAHYDFLGNKSTEVRDLSSSKRYIDSVEDINEAVNDGFYVEVAVIYNSTDAEARYPSNGNVRVPVTIFVTAVVKPDATHVIPVHEFKDKPSEGDDTTDTYTWTAPTGTLYSLDGTNWSGTVQSTNKSGDVVYIKPAKDGFIFVQTPDADQVNYATVEKAAGNSYKITLIMNTFTNVTKTMVEKVTALKLTDAVLYTKLSDPYIFLRFEDENGKWAWTKDDGGTSIISAETAMELAKDKMLADGEYKEVFIEGNNVVVTTKDSHRYTVPKTDINCVGTLVTINGTSVMRNADASIGNTPELSGATGKIRVMHADGTSNFYTDLAAVVSAAVTFKDGDEITVVASNYVTPPAKDELPSFELDKDGKAEVDVKPEGDEKDLTGMLSGQKDDGGNNLWHQDPNDIDYSKLNGKKVSTKMLVIKSTEIPTGATKIQITQENEALKIFSESPNGTLTGSTHTISGIAEEDGSIQIAYVFADDCPVKFTLKYTDNDGAVKGIVTVNIDTTGVTIK